MMALLATLLALLAPNSVRAQCAEPSRVFVYDGQVTVEKVEPAECPCSGGRQPLAPGRNYCRVTYSVPLLKRLFYFGASRVAEITDVREECNRKPGTTARARITPVCNDLAGRMSSGEMCAQTSFTDADTCLEHMFRQLNLESSNYSISVYPAP